ncbi:MAG: hypothetical protein MI867_08555 [Pseudomonadales bacterium]|nr:hypothetical protein [Pseudomonadales bacterium]
MPAFCISKLKKALSAAVISHLSISTALAADITIHTGDPGTSSTGYWYSATAATMPVEGNRGMYSSVSSTVNTYTFQAVMPETNDYTIEVYNTCYSPRSTQVQHTISSDSRSASHTLNQDCQTDPYVGQWRTLDEMSFSAGESVSVTISTEGSNNRYVGAAAVRFTYDESSAQINNPPNLSVSTTNITVNRGDVINLSASAIDAEDGDISSSVRWYSSLQQSIGSTYSVTAQSEDFVIQAYVTDSGGLESDTARISVTVNNPASSMLSFDFNCVLVPLINSSGLQNYNASALPDVGSMCGRYTAQVNDNSGDKTLFFNGAQGRLDGVTVSYPFEAVLRNVGIAPVDQPTQPHVVSGSAYNFVGLHVHHVDFNNINSSHLVVGQRGNTINTIEGKMTRYGNSNQNDAGHNVLPNGRADLRLTMDADGNILAFWQLPNLSQDPAEDNWIPYGGDGRLPGTNPEWGNSGQVIVGIITYAYSEAGVPFWGVAEHLEIIQR